MILAVDIGNSTVGIAASDQNGIAASEKFMTDISETEINYSEKINGFVKSHGFDIDGAVISSVVPLMTEGIKNIILTEYNITPLIVDYTATSAITIKTDQPEKVGSDRIADTVGGVTEYGVPLICIDMGTATTVSVVNEKYEFLGGMIMPGVQTSLNALIKNTALLPQIKLSEPPESIIGTNTSKAIESGIIHGTACCIDGICKRISQQLGCKPSIVATGGNAKKIIPCCDSEIIVDKQLVFKGLNTIYNEYKEKKDA